MKRIKRYNDKSTLRYDINTYDPKDHTHILYEDYNYLTFGEAVRIINKLTKKYKGSGYKIEVQPYILEPYNILEEDVYIL